MISATHSITLHLPEALYQKLEQSARATQRPLEELVVRSIEGNLPPTITDAPPALQAELRALETAQPAELWTVARSQLGPEAQARLATLRAKRPRLSVAESAEFDTLNEQADWLTIKKAYAYALLRWQGFPLPTLETLESEL
jgi:hypothetical protein